MAQSVVYADLRFVKAPRGNSTCSRSQEAALAEEDDAELTYENIRLAQTGEVKRGQGAEQSKEPGWSTWYLPLGLLGACLFLLATTIGLGVRYWQVSQHLQQASRAHEAESSRLSQQVSTKGATLEQMARELEQARQELEQARRELEQARQELEQARGELEQTRQELEQARGELEQTRRELEQARRDMEQTRQELEQARQELEKMRLEENSTQEKLRQLEAALKGSKEELARVQKEKTEIKEKLNKMESALSSICPCKQTGCCLADLVLYRGKCLFVSKEEKTWEESKEDCDRKSARLLIAKSWDSETTLNFLKDTYVQYWIGLRRDWSMGSQWKWVDNSLFEKDWSYQNYYERCGTIGRGVISSDRCNSNQKKPWICEKAASQPSSHGLWFP